MPVWNFTDSSIFASVLVTKKLSLDVVTMPNYDHSTKCLPIAEMTKGFLGDTIAVSWSELVPVQLGRHRFN